MKERPIIFSGPMVRAILDGRKAQTRRVVKPEPPEKGICEFGATDFGDDRPLWHPDDPMDCDCDDSGPFWKCPYGSVGDRLWVRETFQWCPTCGTRNYAASSPKNCNGCDATLGPWKPAIHLPHRASRITLEITGVRVERLQEISEEDAKAEGIETSEVVHKAYQVPGESMAHYVGTAKEAFECLWESIHGPGSWDANPWVWVIDFKRITN